MSTVADKLAKKSSTKSSVKQVRLRLVYIDFWSALKLSFLAGVGIAIATVVAFLLMYLVIQSTSAIDEVDALLGQLTDGEFKLATFLSFSNVLTAGGIVAVLNLIVVTVLGAVLAGIYNLAVKVTGGLLVGFTSN